VVLITRERQHQRLVEGRGRAAKARATVS
jgi:hypothetical protein